MRFEASGTTGVDPFQYVVFMEQVRLTKCFLEFFKIGEVLGTNADCKTKTPMWFNDTKIGMLRGVGILLPEKFIGLLALGFLVS